MPILITQITLDIGYVILSTAGLSFLGLGAEPPMPEWGAMIMNARQYMRESWWYTTFPGLALVLTVLGFNLLGDALRATILDPKNAWYINLETVLLNWMFYSIIWRVENGPQT